LIDLRPAAAERVLTVPRGEVQLFVDDVLIDSQTGLNRTLRSPKKDHGGERPIIAAPDGTTLLAYGSIVRDTKLGKYVMFIQEFPSRQMYRLTSADGMQWDKGDEEPFQKIHFSPLVPPLRERRGVKFNFDLFSCYYDREDSAHPYKGWLYFANCGDDKEGIYYVESADGIRWHRGRMIVNAFASPEDPTCQVIEQDGRPVYGPGDVTVFAPDERRNRFLGLFKFFRTEGVPPGNHLRSRAYAFVDRLDEPFDTSRLTRIALLPPARKTEGDGAYDEYYASTAWRYGSVWLGALKVWHSKEDYPYSAAGCAFLKLVVSRDGLHWSKVPFDNPHGVREVFVPNGPEGGNNGRNDGGYISPFSQGPLRVEDELIYYYSASSYGKNKAHDVRIRGGGIFRGRLRVDGFVSVDGGTLTTRPLRSEGRDLSVNAVGPVRVELLDEQGASVGRAELRGDSLRHRVQFDGETLAEAIPDGAEAMRLRFTVEDGGHLYSFTLD